MGASMLKANMTEQYSNKKQNEQNEEVLQHKDCVETVTAKLLTGGECLHLVLRALKYCP